MGLQHDTMKALEQQYKQYLPKKSFAVIRVDGKGFSKYTKGLDKPFDTQFTADMQETAVYLTENIDGAVLGYTQSDEISIILTDTKGENTEWWFGGKVQKMVSIAAAMATAKFNSLRRDPFGTFALFDARIHHFPDYGMVEEYLDWRQGDAIKNSVGMLASHHFSHKSLHGLSTYQRVQKLLVEKDIVWGDLRPEFREGSWVHRIQDEPTLVLFQKKGVDHFALTQRKRWIVEAAPRFNEDDWEGKIV